MKKIPLLLVILCYTTTTYCQQFWSKQDKSTFQKSNREIEQRKTMPDAYNLYNLQLTTITEYLKTRGDRVILELPDGTGKLKRFQIHSTSNFAPELTAKFPMIQSYTGYGIDDPTAVAKIDIGTKGFHAVIFSGKRSTVYIDPYTKDGASYMVYQRSDLRRGDRVFECKHDEIHVPGKQKLMNVDAKNAYDGMLRTYRLALACTGEYAQFHLNDQGVSPTATDEVKKAAVLSAMNTSMNRLNGVFERDLGVRMEIVADNDRVIFLNPITDGFTDNDLFELVYQNQEICDTEIGTENYDIGHVFGTGGGGDQGAGVAGLGVVCNESSKGLGVSLLGSPINDPFVIDFAAHEFGHQFGANHTQNNDNCVRNDDTAVEPGSASTIMGYAGICTPNVQLFSDDYFHTVNIQEMWNFVQTAGACAVLTDLGNTAPTADAGADVTIPLLTPFVLKGTATDPDGLSSLTYSWEQLDNELGEIIPLASTNVEGPLFRSLPSKTVPERYMPDISTVAAGNISSTWEIVPSVAREMNFAFTVRDNHPGGGNTARDDKVVTVVDSDPFIVTVPNSPLVWEGGSMQTIMWEVGTTNVAPIDCQLVHIKLSTDRGRTFPITILANTPNDGSQQIVIPNSPSTRARIMVEAADNIFYNMSSVDFTITESTVSVDENTLRNFTMFPNPTNGRVNISFDADFSTDVDIQLYDLRGRSVKQFFFANTSGNFTENLDINSMSSGIYLVRILNGSRSVIRKLIVR